jgi:hypothetical protein
MLAAAIFRVKFFWPLVWERDRELGAYDFHYIVNIATVLNGQSEDVDNSLSVRAILSYFVARASGLCSATQLQEISHAYGTQENDQREGSGVGHQGRYDP